MTLVSCISLTMPVGMPMALAEEESNEDGDDLVAGTTRDQTTKEARSKRPSKKGGKLQDIPARKDTLSHLPPMLAVRGLSDSEQMKKVLRSMVTSQVSTLYQTMMMVENGAATGFMGSMQTVSGLLDNATQAAQLELKLKEIADPTGAEALGFANSIHEGMKKQGDEQGKKLWPVGIFYASGDRLDDQQLKPGETIKQELKRHPFGGSTKLDSIRDSSGTSTQGFSGYSDGLQVMQATGDGEDEKKLSKILWGNNNQSQSQSFGTDEQFQLYLVGDLVMKKGDAEQDQPYSVSEAKFEDAKHEVKDKNPPPGATEDQSKLRGFYYWKYKKKQDVWRNTYKLMGEYCQFKSENENRGKKLFEKLTPASRITPTMIKNTSSPSFKWTINLLDIFFKTWVETRNTDPNVPTKIECDFEGSEDPEQSMPDDYKKPDAKFDNCKTDPKHCTRNKWLLQLVDLIAEDRVIDDFRNWHEAAINQALAHHPWVAVKVEELLCTSLRADRSGGQTALCDSTLWLEQIAENNRQRWVRILTDLTKMAQNSVGSSSFRPQQNSVHNGQAGGMESGAGGS